MPRTWAEPGRRGSRGTLPLNRSVRIGPAPTRNCCRAPAGAHAAGSVVVLGGHHLHSGADVVRHPNERSPDRTRLAVDEEPEDSNRSRHRPRGAERQPAFGSFEEVSSGTVVSARPELHPIRWRLARLAIDRASRKRDMAASMWLVRCGCRRRSKATAAPALVGRGLRRGSLCRRAPPCPTWAMAAADRSWVRRRFRSGRLTTP